MPVNVNKTILDVLLEKNRITQAEVVLFDKNLTNSQIEEKLRNENLATSEDIAKSYAIIYDLPYIRLQNYQVSPDAYKVVPEDLIGKYQIVSFDYGKDNRLKIALGEPADLKTNPPAVLEELKEKKGINVDLYITTPEDIKSVTDRFRIPQAQSVVEVADLPKPVNLERPANIKTVDLTTVKIPFEVISKFPIEISRKYKMVVFDSPSQNSIRVAVCDPYDIKVQEILDFVRQKNEIFIEEFVASPGEIDQAINIYYQKPKQEDEISKTTIQNTAAVSAESVKVQPVAAHVSKPLPKPVHPNSQDRSAESSSANKETSDRVDQAFKNPVVPPLEKEKPKFVRRPDEPKSEETPPQTTQEEDMQTITTSLPAEADLDKFLGQEVKSVDTLKEIAQTGHVPNILAATVALAVVKKASDIHIEPDIDHFRIRFRIDGILQDIIKLPVKLHPAILSRIKILSRLKIDEQRIPQDGRFDAKTHNHEIDMRVSTLPTVKGEKAVLRILDKTQRIYSLEELGITGRNLKLVEENITKPYGVIMATGPTGSGKSTTLYSILKKISNPQVNVITLEDPVEYEITGINQCQVKPKIGFSFAEGLRSVLRQDPNIIMVGEIRDAETAGMATHAALTGHLVLTTLHTNDAAGALPRLTNMGIEPFLITSSINLIVGQRLVRKVCPKCKKEIKLPEAIMADIEKELEHLNLPKPYVFYEGSGCEECNNGFSGRIGIYEVLVMTEKVEALAIQRRPTSEIAKAAILDGMLTMKQDGLIKAISGITTVGEVLRVTATEKREG